MNYKGENLYKNMIGGSISGMLSLTATYPTEYVKTLKQMGDKRTFYGIIRDSYRVGLFTLYRGYIGVGVSIIPRAGINYGLYEYCCYKYNKMGINRNLSNVMAGLTSGGVAGLILATPVENIKINRISGKGGMVDLYRSENIGGFYKGFYPTVLKEATTYGSRFFIYTTIYGKVYEKTHNVFLSSFLGGSMAGFVSSYLNNPIDVIQTRKQMPKGHTMNMSLGGIIKNEGIKSLYSGVVIRSLRTIPTTVISFMSYEYLCKKILKLN